MSACDIVKALLSGKRHIIQESPHPVIPIIIESVGYAQHTWYTMHPLLNRAKFACDLGMVVDPVSLFAVGPTTFIEKNEHKVRYQNAMEWHEGDVNFPEIF